MPQRCVVDHGLTLLLVRTVAELCLLFISQTSLSAAFCCRLWFNPGIPETPPSVFRRKVESVGFARLSASPEMCESSLC
jgi:hypothetical protein